MRTAVLDYLPPVSAYFQHKTAQIQCKDLTCVRNLPIVDEFSAPLDRHMISVFMYRFQKSLQLQLSQSESNPIPITPRCTNVPGPLNETAHDLFSTPERQSPKSLVMLPNILTDRHGGPN